MHIDQLTLQAYRASCYQLVTRPHPLSPDTIDLPTALRLMRAAVERQGGSWRLLWIGYYILSTEVDADVFWPEAATIAQSHCSGCGDVLCLANETHCQACKEYERIGAFGEPSRFILDAA